MVVSGDYSLAVVHGLLVVVAPLVVECRLSKLRAEHKLVTNIDFGTPCKTSV